MADKKEVEESCKEKIQLPSPPKPTRMIKIETPTSQATFSKSNYASSLPALAGEVALAQKDQILKLEKRFDVLQQVKKNYEEALRAKAVAERDMQAVSRKSNMLQDEIELHQINCDKIHKEIGALVSDIATLKRNIDASEAELALKKSDNETYRTRMKSYEELVKIIERSSVVNKNIEHENNEIEILKKERQSLQEGMEIDKLLSGECREIALAELVTLEETKEELEESLTKNVKLEEAAAKQSKLRREIELLQKKYQAQLTWTRKQLQETTARNKQWSEEATQKERQIQELKEKIEQCGSL